VQSYPLTEGQVTRIGGVRNLSVPGDDDGLANGQIRSAFSFQAQSEINIACGRYVYRVSPVGVGLRR